MMKKNLKKIKFVLFFILFGLNFFCYASKNVTELDVFFENNQHKIDGYINKKNIELCLQQLSQILDWNCVPCQRCGDDQVDIKDEGLILIKWNESQVIYSNKNKIIRLPTSNRVEGDKTFVNIKLISALGYKVKINNKTKEIHIFKTKNVLEREKSYLNKKKSMSALELKEYLDTHKMWDGVFTPIQNAQGALLDVRNEDEYKLGTIPGAVLFSLSRLKQEIPLFPKDKKIIVFCEMGSRSSEAAVILRRQGFEDVEDFGGINKWNEVFNQSK